MRQAGRQDSQREKRRGREREREKEGEREAITVIEAATATDRKTETDAAFDIKFKESETEVTAGIENKVDRRLWLVGQRA